MADEKLPQEIEEVLEELNEIVDGVKTPKQAKLVKKTVTNMKNHADIAFIQRTINEEVNTLLKLHNGSCEAVSLKDGVLTVHLNGGCVGCPASKITLMNLVIPVLKEKHPNTVKDVILDV